MKLEGIQENAPWTSCSGFIEELIITNSGVSTNVDSTRRKIRRDHLNEAGGAIGETGALGIGVPPS